MGTRVGIIGPNGAGKSTLMNLGDLEPTVRQPIPQAAHQGTPSTSSMCCLWMKTLCSTACSYLAGGSGYKPGGDLRQAGVSSFNNHLTPIVKLSGGQKARVVFPPSISATPHSPNGRAHKPPDAVHRRPGDALTSLRAASSSSPTTPTSVARFWTTRRARSGCERAGDKFAGDFEDYRNQLVKEISVELDDDY